MRERHERGHNAHLDQLPHRELPRPMALPELGIDAFRSCGSVLIDGLRLLLRLMLLQAIAEAMDLTIRSLTISNLALAPRIEGITEGKARPSFSMVVMDHQGHALR